MGRPGTDLDRRLPSLCGSQSNGADAPPHDPRPKRCRQLERFRRREYETAKHLDKIARRRNMLVTTYARRPRYCSIGSRPFTCRLFHQMWWVSPSPSSPFPLRQRDLLSLQTHRPRSFAPQNQLDVHEIPTRRREASDAIGISMLTLCSAGSAHRRQGRSAMWPAVCHCPPTSCASE